MDMKGNGTSQVQKIKSANKNRFTGKTGGPWAGPITLRIRAAIAETQTNCDLLLRYLVQRGGQARGNAD
ncbi:MAG: hypothetical protein WCW52_11980 [Elusimicrobiales bacterium]|jgi:hypothetical protein